MTELRTASPAAEKKGRKDSRESKTGKAGVHRDLIYCGAYSAVVLGKAIYTASHC